MFPIPDTIKTKPPAWLEKDLVSLNRMPTKIQSLILSFLGKGREGNALNCTCITWSKRTFSKYAIQVIFTLLGGTDVDLLQQKANSKGLRSIVIDLRSIINGKKRDREQIAAQFSQLKLLPISLDKIRLYFDAHGNYCRYNVTHLVSDRYSDGSRDSYSVQDLVMILKTYAPQFIQRDEGRRIKVSILACESAYDIDKEEQSQSVGAIMSQLFDKAHIPAEVIARTGEVTIEWDDETNTMFKAVDDTYHAFRTKYAITTVDGSMEIQPVTYTRKKQDYHRSDLLKNN